MTSTVASTKKSVLTIKRRGSVLLARSQGPGLVDFSIRSDIYSPKSRDIPGDGIELAPGMRMRNTSVRGNASGSPSQSVAVIDPASSSRSRNLEGRSGRAILAGNVLAAKTSSLTGRAASVRPNSQSTEHAGRAFPTPVRRRGPPPPLISPEQKSADSIDEASSHGDKVDADGRAGHHHANSSGIPGHHWTSELQPAYGTPPGTGEGLEHSTGDSRRPQSSREHADVEGSGINRTQTEWPEGNRPKAGERDNTAGTKIGNLLMELPLSKLKIVIGTLPNDEQTAT